MPNYQESKIYKLVSNISDDIYIGSTVNRLSHRLNQHKNKHNSCVSKNLFTNDAVIQIILIEILLIIAGIIIIKIKMEKLI